MKIEVLGSGCANCRRLDESVREACVILGIRADISKVTDYGKIASFGVSATPALAVDGDVLFEGRVPGSKEIAKMLKERC